MTARLPRWLAYAAFVCAGALAAAGCSREQAAPAETSVYGVALHVHGSFSEGPASMRAHALAASALGGAVDVIWWTDHDWRIAGHSYVEAFDFEQGLIETELAPAALRMPQLDGREPFPAWAEEGYVATGDSPAERFERERFEPGRFEEVQKGFSVRHVPRRDTRVRMEVREGEARRGERSLHVALAGPQAGRRDRLVLAFEATRRRHIASLASGVVLRISVLPAEQTGDASLVLGVGLSQAAPGEKRRLDYVLWPARDGASPPPATVETRPLGEGGGTVRVATIPVASEPGVWNDWVLDLGRDTAQHDLGGADNSLVDLSLTFEVAPGARLEAFVDALAIERARLGPPLFEAERTLAAELTDEAMAHHVGQEISYAAHLNAYGAAIPLADLARHPHGLTPAQAVELAHRHGGLVSLAHVFGTEFESLSHRFPNSRVAFDETVARLIERRAFGVDLLEVGYRSRGHGLDAFVELWDSLSAAGVRVVGIGVSDSHDAEVGWSSGPNNFLTWVHAASREEEDLLDGLRAGRAFFGDPTRFDGSLDLATARGGRMGDRLEVPPGRERVTIRARGLRAGQTIRVVRDGATLAEHVPSGEAFEATHELDVDAPTFVRAEILEAGAPIVLGNPIHFLPSEGDGAPRERD